MVKKIVDKETNIQIPENQFNKEVMEKMRICSNAELLSWRSLVQSLVDAVKNSGKNDDFKEGFTPQVTLKYLDYEIKRRKMTTD